MCSVHFISSEPASLFDETNPDWIPTVNMDTKSMKAETVMLIVTVTIVGSEGDLMLSMLRRFTIVIKVVIISDHDDSEVPGVACQTEETSNL